MTETPNIGIFRLQLFKISEGFISQQARSLRRYDPVFIGRKLFGPAPPTADIVLPVPNNILSQVLISGFRYTRPFRRGLETKKHQLALIHAHFGVDGIYALRLAKSLNVPLVTTLHGFDVSTRDSVLLTSLRPALINSVLYRRALARDGDLFICVSEFIRRAALAKGFPAEKLRVHYMGIDTDSLIPDFERQNSNTIVHVARLVEKKGTEYLIEAAKILKDHSPNLKVKVIGDGVLREKLEKQASSLGDTIEFLGALSNKDTIAHIKSCAVVAVPSVTARSGDSEGLPIVTLETAALGVPIVATDSGGISEAIIDGKTGYIVSERDVPMLSDRLGRLLNDPAEARAMGLLARHHAEQNFNIARQSEKLEKIYDDLLSRANRRT